MSYMFGPTVAAGSGSGSIVEFKAGKSTLEPGAAENLRKVVANPKKGLVYVRQSNDMLVHFCWKDRETGEVVDDLIIFPGDTEFKAVNGCPDGKVYMLKFKSSKEMRLYWLQDGSPDADKDIVRKVNDALNKPPTTRSVGRGSASDRKTAGSGFPAALSDDFGGPLGGLDQSQLMSLIQTLQGNNSSDVPALLETVNADSSEADVDPSTVVPNESTASSGNAQQQMNTLTTTDLTKILKNLRPGGSGERVNVSLSDHLATPSTIETAQANSEKLKPHLPETDEGADKELTETVRTVPFKQAVDTFTHALQTGQLAPVLSQFGLNEETVQSATQGDLRGFAKNLTSSEGGPVPKEEEEKKEDESETVAKEPDAKRNRPDLDDMDVD